MNPDTLKDYWLAVQALKERFPARSHAIQLEYHYYGSICSDSKLKWTAWLLDYGWTGEYPTPMQAVGELLAKVK